MKKRKIPETAFAVSQICLGTMTFGTPVGEPDAVKLVHYALDKGVNFIDTANMYEGYARKPGSAGGVAEEFLGKALAGRRKDVVLATKLGMKVGNNPEDEGTGPAAIRTQLDKSLKRLATDYIDVYYLHRPDTRTSLVEIIAALDREIRAGKILHYGISNYSAEQLAELLKTAAENHLPRPVVCQPPLSLLKPDALKDIIPLCAKESIAVAPYQVLQGGLLTGKYRRGAPVPAGSRKAEQSTWVGDLTDELFNRLETIETEAEKKNLAMTSYAIRWALEQPAVVSVVIGVKHRNQIDEAVAAAET